MACLGVILARGGSKRIPRKNLRMLGRQPLIAWSIGVGMASPMLDGLVVSSEDDDILEVARDYGCETIRRPAEMATDSASSYPALLHALDCCEMPVDYVCLLQPTSPYRTIDDVDNCVALCETGEYPAVVSRTVGHMVPNGAVYVGRSDWLRDGGNFDGPAVGFYDMPEYRSIDIDTEEDWLAAERYLMGLCQ